MWKCYKQIVFLFTSVRTAVVYNAPCMFSAINLVFIFTDIYFQLTSLTAF